MKLYLQNEHVVYKPEDYIEMEAQWPKITKDMTPEEVMEIHRRIWDYVVKYKYKPETPYKSDCALCEYSRKMVYKMMVPVGDMCKYCIAQWPRDITCECVNSLYHKWMFEHDVIRRRELAIQIRDIPMKKEKVL